MKLYFAIFFLLCSCSNSEPQSLTVYSASSLIQPITEINQTFEKNNNIKVYNSFASSSTLAKKISKTKNADIFFSADYKWISYLKVKKQIQKENDIMTNSLVLVSSAKYDKKIKLEKDFPIQNVITDCFAMGDPEYVPVGKYSEQFLSNIGWLDKIPGDKKVYAQDAVSNLKTIETGKCNTGIVFKTDALTTKKIKIIAEIPENTHQEIKYTIALIKDNNQSQKLYDFLNSKTSKDIFTKYGFKVKD